MIKMLSANDASFLSAGMGEPPHKQELQKLLDLIESEVIYAASAGRNKAPLLGEEFKGWDSANISELHDVMSWVFQILREEGYGFHTEQMLQIGNVASTCSQVPYPHTVVTWPEAQSPEGQIPEAQTELTLEERTEIADSLGKDLEYVDPIFAQPTMPPKGVFPPTTLPAPGTPMQLIEYLRQKGYKMQGFGCLVEVKHKPTNWDTCRAIGTLVLNLVEVHRSGSPKEPTTSLLIEDYPEIDVKYLRGAFAEVGLLVQHEGDLLECRWPASAWDYFEPAPMPALSTPAMLPLPREKSFPVLGSRIGKFVVALRQAGFDVASSKDMLPQDLLDLEKFEDDPETGKAYENVLECLLEAVKRGDSELQMCLSIDCKIGRIAQYLRPLGFSGDCTVHEYRAGKPAHALLIIKWSAIKC